MEIEFHWTTNSTTHRRKAARKIKRTRHKTSDETLKRLQLSSALANYFSTRNRTSFACKKSKVATAVPVQRKKIRVTSILFFLRPQNFAGRRTADETINEELDAFDSGHSRKDCHECQAVILKHRGYFVSFYLFNQPTLARS